MNLDDPNLQRSLSELSKISASYTTAVSAAMKHVHIHEQIFESIQKPMQTIIDTFASNQRVYDQMAEAFTAFNFPRIVTGDLLQTWAVENTDIDDVVEDPAELAETLSFDLVESIETKMDEQPFDDTICALQVTTDGRLHLIEDPDINIDLTVQMEHLIRDLTKRFKSTKHLIYPGTYSTIRSIQTAVQKLNRWGRIKFNMTKPIVIGSQGKGYRLSKHIQIRKLPSKFDG